MGEIMNGWNGNKLKCKRINRELPLDMEYICLFSDHLEGLAILTYSGIMMNLKKKTSLGGGVGGGTIRGTS